MVYIIDNSHIFFDHREFFYSASLPVEVGERLVNSVEGRCCPPVADRRSFSLVTVIG